jgi:hypothetical protein
VTIGDSKLPLRIPLPAIATLGVNGFGIGFAFAVEGAIVEKDNKSSRLDFKFTGYLLLNEYFKFTQNSSKGYHSDENIFIRMIDYIIKKEY